MDLNNTANRVIGVIVLLLIFIGGWWLIARNTVGTSGAPVVSTDTGSTAGDTKTTTIVEVSGSPLPTTTPTVEASGEAVEVADQPAGMTVAVGGAKLAGTG